MEKIRFKRFLYRPLAQSHAFKFLQYVLNTPSLLLCLCLANGYEIVKLCPRISRHHDLCSADCSWTLLRTGWHTYSEASRKNKTIVSHASMLRPLTQDQKRKLISLSAPSTTSGLLEGIERNSQQVQSNISYTGRAGRPSRSVRCEQELPLEMIVLWNKWSLKAENAFRNNGESLQPFLNWEFKFQSVGGKKRKAPPIPFFLENAWIETSWNRHTTAINCYAKRSEFIKRTQQKFITHSKLLQAWLCNLQFGNLRHILSICINHKEMDGIHFWENKQIQTSKNITITAQMPFTTIELVGCHGGEASCRDSSEQMCSVDHVHNRWVRSAYQSDSRTCQLSIACQAVLAKRIASRQSPQNERYFVRWRKGLVFLGGISPDCTAEDVVDFFKRRVVVSLGVERWSPVEMVRRQLA